MWLGFRKGVKKLAGFTLVEVMVACSMLCLIAVGVEQSLNLSVRLAQVNTTSFTATKIAEAFFEQLRSNYTEAQWNSAATSYTVSYYDATTNATNTYSLTANSWTAITFNVPNMPALKMQFYLFRGSTPTFQSPFYNPTTKLSAAAADTQAVSLVLDYQWASPRGPSITSPTWIRATVPFVGIRYLYP